MTHEEATEFVRMVDGAWQPGLTDVQKDLWLDLCLPLNAIAAFRLLMRLFKTEPHRPKPPDYMGLYRRELADSTSLHLPSLDRDEMPEWVRGWRLAFASGDTRAWPEQERGARELHAWWLEETLPASRKGTKSGHEWEDFVHERGLMPQADRLEYIRRAKAGEGPQTGKQMVDAVTSSPAAADAGTLPG